MVGYITFLTATPRAKSLTMQISSSSYPILVSNLSLEKEIKTAKLCKFVSHPTPYQSDIVSFYSFLSSHVNTHQPHRLSTKARLCLRICTCSDNKDGLHL